MFLLEKSDVPTNEESTLKHLRNNRKGSGDKSCSQTPQIIDVETCSWMRS